VLTAYDHAWPRFGDACARVGYPVDAAPAFPANADAADRSFGVAALIDPEATLTGLEQSSSHALTFKGRYQLAFKTKLKSGRHVQPGAIADTIQRGVFSWTDKAFLTGISTA
jgi:hypothetical protein